jgi:ribonuclease P protein component
MKRLSQPPHLERLRHRPDFVAASSGKRAPCAGFVVQGRERDDASVPRVGFTVSKKVGNAVERNRARRRLREVVRLSAAERLSPGTDYVLVARRPTLSLSFARLTADFLGALGRLARDERPTKRRGGGHDTLGPPPQGAEQGKP